MPIMEFHITSDSAGKYTQIPNLFIKKYMPSANGNFVKLYLHLMMVCQQEAAESLSVNTLADCMECTENDVLRALHYWQREGVLTLRESENGIAGITLHDPAPDRAKDVAAPIVTVFENTAKPPVRTVSPEPAQTGNFPVPDKQNYTPLQAEALTKDAEIDRTITAIEEVLGEPVSPSHLQTILYFMCDVGFSQSLLVTLYETAVRKGKKKPNYIEAIGISWARKGIRTPEDAQEESVRFSGRYALVSKAFGIRRNLAPAEREIIDGWDSYHFADGIIEEACRRTVLQTGDTNLNYASKILKNWHDKEVISLRDIEKYDQSFKRQRKETNGSRKIGTSKNQFQNFPQRVYSKNDYSTLERQLLQGQASAVE